ncbi:MAG: GH3 auxin-responsive promoter family protein, partial [Bacteroidetes bacterium]|nr:GH3 auxin-responsive promoter family protein [Bacteroidota bacterium]
MALFKISLSSKTIREEQDRVLKKLIRKAKSTSFGRNYQFEALLNENNIASAFATSVPTFNYNRIYKEWWSKSINGESDVCWPGKIQYYALSSGTSEAASKYIPITTALLAGNKNIMVRQLLTLMHYKNIPYASIAKGWLTIGGSTDLQKGNGFYAGDLSGITAKKAPLWFRPFYKPGRKIAKEKDWHKKLEEIVEKAPSWDIGFVVGVPAWVQMCFEMIIERYKLNNIHEMWPNLAFYGHGGMSFEPYKIGFERLLGKPLTYIETYLASEGFLAYQDHQDAIGMRLVTDEHIFFEFVPFNEKNFDDLGELKENISS